MSGVIIPDMPPARAVTLRRYVAGDIRSCPERRELAVRLAKAYHDDWAPMVEAASLARHENNLPVGVAQMVLNWGRSQASVATVLEQFEWQLLPDETKEAKIIDIADRAEKRELARREREEEREEYFKNHRHDDARTNCTVKPRLAVAANRGKVVHRVDEGSLIIWPKKVYVKKERQWRFFDDVGAERPGGILVLVTGCKPNPMEHHSLKNPLLFWDHQVQSLIFAGHGACKSGCWNTGPLFEDRPDWPYGEA